MEAKDTVEENMGTAYDSGYWHGRKAGIREVVEWRMETCPHRAHNAKYFKPKCACEKCWQAQLKEWRI